MSLQCLKCLPSALLPKMSVPDLDIPWVSLSTYGIFFGVPRLSSLRLNSLRRPNTTFLGPLEMLLLSGRLRVEWLGARASEPSGLALPHPGRVARALEAQTTFRMGCHSLSGQ